MTQGDRLFFVAMTYGAIAVIIHSGWFLVLMVAFMAWSLIRDAKEAK